MHITWLCWILTLLNTSVAGHRPLEFLTMEERLYRNLTNRFSDLRPVEKSSDTVNVTFGISFVTILDVDENKGFTTLEGIMPLKWIAPSFAWEPSDYNEIESLKFPIDKIWQPDISILYGGLDATKTGSSHAVISSDGIVKWFPPVTIKMACQRNMRNFPYDMLECQAAFGSQSYHGNEVSLDTQQKKAYIIHSNPVWELSNSSLTRMVRKFDWPHDHIVLLDLQFKRKNTFLSYLYISPMVLIALMSPFMFLLPYQQSQRFSLGGSLLICLVMLLVGLDFVLPKTTTGLPLISMYYMSIIVLVLGSMIISAVILNMAEKMSDPPQILKTIVGSGLGSILWVRKENYSNLVEGADEDELKAKKQDEVTWRYIAAVLDRFFFFVYIVLTIILSIAFTVPR